MFRLYLYVVLASAVCSLEAYAQAPTWSSDIARIVYSNCTPCHRTGEIAPFTLESYNDVVSFSGSVKRAVNKREMPPWPPAKGHGSFLGDRSLSDADIAKITAWVDAGTPLGNLENAPRKPEFPSGSQLGVPDLVLEMAETWTVQGNSKDVYRFFVLPTRLLENKNIAALEFRPGNAKVVHHVLFFLDTTGTARARDASDPLPGYSGFGDPGFESAASYLGWVPGSQQRFYPETVGARLFAKSDLVIQVHYAPSSTEETDRSSVNVFFHKSNQVRVVQEFALSPRNLVAGQSFVIPANTVRSFTTKYTVPADVSMIAVGPHMHLLGTTCRAYAVTSKGDTISLININKWDFHWQGGYAYRNPVRIPRGSVLHYEASYDNTVNNLNNPNSPPKLVTWGESTTDEMLLCYFHWLLYQSGDEQMVMETSTPTSITDLAGETFHACSASPNPSATQVRFSFQQKYPSLVWLALSDALGNSLAGPAQSQWHREGNCEWDLDVSLLAPGTYFAALQTSEGYISVPFVVSR